jgi:hypothetical protein
MLGIIVVTTSTHDERLYVNCHSHTISLSNVLIPKAAHLSAHTHPHALRWSKTRMRHAMELI